MQTHMLHVILIFFVLFVLLVIFIAISVTTALLIVFLLFIILAALIIIIIIISGDARTLGGATRGAFIFVFIFVVVLVGYRAATAMVVLTGHAGTAVVGILFLIRQVGWGRVEVVVF